MIRYQSTLNMDKKNNNGINVDDSKDDEEYNLNQSTANK